MAIEDVLKPKDVRDVDAGVLISADSHVLEPGDLWTTRLPQGLRGDAPSFERPFDPSHKPRQGGWDPVRRLEEIAQDGVSGEILFPTSALSLYRLENAELQEGCFRVYNDWLAEFCQAAPNRFFGVAAISVYDVDRAIAELKRCKAAGMVGALIWQVPHPDLPFTSDHYERFWAAAADLQMPVCLHILTGFDYSSKDRGGPLEAQRGSVNHKVNGISNTLFDVIFSGVLERHPGLQVTIVESEAGWIPFYLQQWDYYVRRFGSTKPDGVRPLGIRMLPSEYFERQLSATFSDDGVASRLFTWWGNDRCMWSTDYPHANSKWPESRANLAKNIGHLDQPTIAKLVRENAAKLYNIEVPSAISPEKAASR